MKKLFYSLVFLLMSGSIFMACSNEDDIVMQEDSSLSSKALTRSASLRRSLTSQEEAELKAIFPNLNTHGRTELSGSNYGSILVSFVKSNSKMSALKEVAEEVAKEDIVLSDLERNRVFEESRKVNSEIVDKFESLVAEWENEIQTNPQTKFSSSTLDYKKLPQFKSLQEMGRVIIPLIMEKLLDEDNFFMLPLYDALQVDSTLKVTYSKNDPKCLEGEQNRARRTVRMWINSL